MPAVLILRYYEKKGILDFPSISHAGLKNNLPGYIRAAGPKTERVAFTDCIYRNMYKFKFIAVVDIDEAIIPGTDYTWSSMMANRLKKTYGQTLDSMAALKFNNVYFFDEQKKPDEWADGVPKYMHMLQHVRKTRTLIDPGIASAAPKLIQTK